ncbi:pentatricopeptide repeat-containing protein At4g19191, mitochondrial-like [Punica granatum]|uniref:Pentatricopeptide repeat-containing protein At4g19191, mitochondrial-like n=1 Tax=Punica granatum TaxID=22663 RepID=A0A6P8DTT4_PUNGR|nr:pentatricopeptide repeat-containing protein At4g19191, mitochondrial-like [Punica granatum]
MRGNPHHTKARVWNSWLVKGLTIGIFLNLRILRESVPTIATNCHVFGLPLFVSFTSKLPLLLRSCHLNPQRRHLTALSPSHVPDSTRNHQALGCFHIAVSPGYESALFASKLISRCAEFNDLAGAVSVFNSLDNPNIVLWNLIIKAHVDLGAPREGLVLYRRMRESAVKHDQFTFPIVNRAISAVNGDVLCAGMVHCLAVKMGFEADLYFCNTMIDAYCKRGKTSSAVNVFETMAQRDLVSWTSMISGWLSGGSAAMAVDLFNAMRIEFDPNAVTVMILLQGCCAPERLILGRQLHCLATKSGLLSDAFVRNSVLRMYARGGELKEVEIFSNELDENDIVSWNILISFYSARRDTQRVVGLFNEMQHKVPLKAETLTLVVSTLANSNNKSITQGEMLHCYALKSGLRDIVLETSLLDFYTKFGHIENSFKLFEEIPHKNSVTWNAVMSGFIRNWHFEEAIGAFHQMLAAGLEPTPEILTSLTDGCAHISALRSGREVHGYLIRNLFSQCWEEHTVTHLNTSIINMYFRCGDISSARLYFNTLVTKDTITWSSMIEGYGTHGLGSEAVQNFQLMLDEGAEPNGVTFLSLLAACSHSGLVAEGCRFFSMMEQRFNIDPDLDHYTCLVDLLARSGRLKDALAVITKRVSRPDSRIWGAILAASRIYGDRKVGKFAGQRLLELESDNVGYYTLLSNVQASDGNWSQVEMVRQEMTEKDLKKKPGWSCFMDRGRIHGFISGDRTHCEADKVYEILQQLGRNIRETHRM